MSAGTFTIDSLAQAIAREEGFNNESVGTSANNPGNLELGDIGYGTVSAAGGNQITVFSSLQDGWNALTNILIKAATGGSSVYSPNESLGDFMTTYTGGNTNAGNTVSSILGIPSSTPLSSFGLSSGSGAQSTNSSQNSVPSSAQNAQSAQLTGLLKLLTSILSSILSPNADGSFHIPSVMDIVVILAGLVLLTGAVFGFKNITNTTVTVAKKGAELATG